MVGSGGPHSRTALWRKLQHQKAVPKPIFPCLGFPSLSSVGGRWILVYGGNENGYCLLSYKPRPCSLRCSSPVHVFLLFPLYDEHRTRNVIFWCPARIIIIQVTFFQYSGIFHSFMSINFAVSKTVGIMVSQCHSLFKNIPNQSERNEHRLCQI